MATEGAESLSWPRTKLRRASRLSHELKDLVLAWEASSSIGGQPVVAEDRMSWRLSLEVPPAPWLEWSAYVGDLVHNLRSALDAAVWARATEVGKVPEKPKQICFPIVENPDSWPRAERENLAGVDPEVVERIRLVQPMQRPPHERERDGLCLLQYLSNEDKHRSAVSVYLEPQGAEHSFRVEFSEDVDPETMPDSGISDDGRLLLFQSPVPILGVRGNVNLQLVTAISTPLGPASMFDSLAALGEQVSQIVDLVEQPTTGATEVS